MDTRNFLLLWLFLVGYPGITAAQSVVTLTADDSVVALGEHAGVWVDEHAQLSLADVSEAGFQAHFQPLQVGTIACVRWRRPSASR